MERINKEELDWYKEKSVKIRNRGTLALIASSIVKNGTLVPQPKARCVWPSSFTNGESRFISRRVKAQEIINV